MHLSRTLAEIVLATCLLVVFASSLTACSTNDSTPANVRQIELAKSNSQALIRFYLGGLTEPPANPERSELLTVDGNAYLLHVDSLSAVDSSLAAQLGTSPGNRIDWDTFENTFTSRYYEDRNIPNHIDSLTSRFWNRDDSLFTIEVLGTMTSALRRISVPEHQLRTAVLNYSSNNNSFLYPVSTLFVADHLLADTVVESTAMFKRADGFWDYAVFDHNGFLVDSTITPPKTLRAPEQCTGCHFGNRAFEPEKSFPAAAPRGPEGPRRIIYDRHMPGGSLVSTFNEHGKRSDRILGLYGTLYVNSRLLQSNPPDSAIHAAFGDLVETNGIANQ